MQTNLSDGGVLSAGDVDAGRVGREVVHRDEIDDLGGIREECN